MFRGFSMGSPCSELDFPKRPWRHFSWGQSWLDSNPEADAEEIKEKHKEIEGAVLKLKKSWGWLVVWNHGILWLSILIGNVIIPTDEVIFFRGDETTHQFYNMGMDQYLLIPFLGEWTSIYQLFWCSPGVQGFDTLPYIKIMGARIPVVFFGGACSQTPRSRHLRSHRLQVLRWWWGCRWRRRRWWGGSTWWAVKSCREDNCWDDWDESADDGW